MQKKEPALIGLAASRANLYLCLLVDDALCGNKESGQHLLPRLQFEDVVAALHWEVAQIFDCPHAAWHTSDCHVCCTIFAIYTLAAAKGLVSCGEFLESTREGILTDIAQRVHFDLRPNLTLYDVPKDKVWSKTELLALQQSQHLLHRLAAVRPRLTLYDIQELPSDVEPMDVVNNAETLICPRDKTRLKVLESKPGAGAALMGWEAKAFEDRRGLYEEIQNRLGELEKMGDAGLEFDA